MTDSIGLKFMDKKVTITGGCGFIGSHLAERLDKLKAEVTVFDRHRNLTERVENCRLWAGDIRDPGDVQSAVAGADYVFHLAANASIPYSFEHPVETEQTNVIGTINVAQACRANGARLVFASSCSVYGNSTGSLGLTYESTSPNPLSPYALQKLAGEGYVRLLANGTSLRFFNVYGPGQSAGSPYSGVIAKFCQSLIKGERPVVYGDGKQTRDFVYVADVVEALLLAALSPETPGNVFNIGTGYSHALNGVLALLSESKGVKALEPRYLPAREGDIRHSVTDPTVAKRRFGWEPKTALKDGLDSTLDYFRRTL